MTTAAFAMLDLVRLVVTRWLHLKRPGVRILDANVMLPLLAIYVRQYGDDAVEAPIPADRLMETVMANPPDREITQRYASLAEWMANTSGYENYR